MILANIEQNKKNAAMFFTAMILMIIAFFSVPVFASTDNPSVFSIAPVVNASSASSFSDNGFRVSYRTSDQGNDIVLGSFEHDSFDCRVGSFRTGNTQVYVCTVPSSASGTFTVPILYHGSIATRDFTVSTDYPGLAYYSFSTSSNYTYPGAVFSSLDSGLSAASALFLDRSIYGTGTPQNGVLLSSSDYTVEPMNFVLGSGSSSGSSLSLVAKGSRISEVAFFVYNDSPYFRCCFASRDPFAFGRVTWGNNVRSFAPDSFDSTTGLHYVVLVSSNYSFTPAEGISYFDSLYTGLSACSSALTGGSGGGSTPGDARAMILPTGALPIDTDVYLKSTIQDSSAIRRPESNGRRILNSRFQINISINRQSTSRKNHCSLVS